MVDIRYDSPSDMFFVVSDDGTEHILLDRDDIHTTTINDLIGKLEDIRDNP